MALLKKKHDILFWGLAGLILYMPFHYYLCELLLSGSGVDNIFRDVLILGLTALVFFSKDTFSKPLSLSVTVSCLVLAFFGITSTILNKSLPILNILRTYLVPMMLFYICKSVELDKKRFSLLNRFLVVELAIIAAYGFFQAFFLTDDFLILLGYPNNGEALSSTSYYIAYFFGYQRSVGTFVSPNVCGVILAVALCALLFTDVNSSFYRKYAWGSLLILGLLATFSRSSMLGFAMACGFFVLIAKSWKRLSKKTIKRCLLIVGTAGAFLLFDQLVLDGLFLRMLMSSILRTFTGEDPSANAHKEHIVAPPAPVSPLPNPLMKFGLNGPMAAEYVKSPSKVESAFYLMEYEMGTIGAIIYFIPYILLILQTVVNHKRYPYFVPATVSIAVLVSYVFLPNVQTFEVTFYCFLFMGLYCNRSVKQLYCKPEDMEDVTVKELLRTCIGCIKRIPLFLSLLVPRSKNIYIFGAWLGEKFSDNSRALYLYALENTDKKCFWICKNRKLYQQLEKEGLPVLMASSPKGIYYQLRAGVAFSCIGDGDFFRELLGNCVHVELWHGVGGGKTIGLDDREYRKNALSFHGRVYTKLEKFPMRKHYFVCTSDEMKKVFQTAFLIPDDHFILAGQPRNDMFYDPAYQCQTISKEEFSGKKVIVYMPTHRKTGQASMDMSQLLDLDALNRFCEENNAVFLIKKHFYHREETEHLDAYPHIFDITQRALDSNELLMVADYLISDYSSCTADYLLLDRPLFYYCFDYQEYIREDRQMYWEFEDITPGPRCQTFEQLLSQLKLTLEQGQDSYQAERKRVREMFYAPSCQCTASDKILEQVAAITDH